MNKSDLITHLDGALELLTKAADHSKLPKKDRAAFGSFVEQVQEARAADANGTDPLHRVAQVVNPKTGRTVTVGVKADGSQLPRFSYLPDATEWRIVRAPSWAEASAKARAGEGELVKAKGRKGAPTKKTAPKKPRKRTTKKAAKKTG